MNFIILKKTNPNSQKNFIRLLRIIWKVGFEKFYLLSCLEVSTYFCWIVKIMKGRDSVNYEDSTVNKTDTQWALLVTQ